MIAGFDCVILLRQRGAGLVAAGPVPPDKGRAVRAAYASPGRIAGAQPESGKEGLDGRAPCLPRRRVIFALQGGPGRGRALADGERDECRKFVMNEYLDAASVVLCAGHLLSRADLSSPKVPVWSCVGVVG